MNGERVSRTIDGCRVVVSCGREQAALAADVLTTFERIATQGGLRPGLRVRVGWSMLTLQAQADGTLIVCEPDFGGDPLTEVRPRIETTLSVLADQTRLIRRAGVTPRDATFDQMVIVARGALGAPAINLFRSEPEDANDSGWSVTAADAPEASESADDFEAVRSYMFLQVRRVVLSALMLPVGTAVVIEGERVAMVLAEDGRDLLSAPNGGVA